MPDFRFLHRRDSLVKSFLAARLQDLDQATCKRDKPSEKFVPYACLEDIWTDARLEEFVDLIRPGFDRVLIPLVKENLLRTLSILVYISWQDWALFGATFVHHRNAHGERDRLDDRVPRYTLETLTVFLDRICAGRFLAERWTFCPIVLEEGKTQQFSGDWRLPFINPQPIPIGSGGYGQVTKEVIASRQFVAFSALPRALYQDEFPVARKRYPNRLDFRRETHNLEFIRSSRLHHRHIVSYLSIVVVGSEYNMLSPLAEMDLEHFLGQQAQGLLLGDLIGEARNVVGALGFLHGMLQTNHPGLACCHNDLKPANILVFREPDSSAVGTWKIADFGISIIAEPDEQPSAMVDVTPTGKTLHYPPPRNASTYQAPEVCHGGDIGRKSDVWSMGCILVRILALGIDGLAGLKTLDDARGQAAAGEEDCEHDYFHRGSPPYLNPHVVQWLDSLPGRAPADVSAVFWRESCELLRSMLAIPKHARPPAEAVFQRLNHIRQLAPRDARVTAYAQPILITPTDSGPSAGGSLSPRSTPLSNVSMPSIPVKYVVDAISSGQMDDLENLLSRGSNIDEPHDGDRPILHAIKRKNLAAVEILRHHNPALDVETPSQDGQTPLAIASTHGDPELVDILLEMGAPIDSPSVAGMTPLMHAARWGHNKAVATLLNQNANCQLYSLDGWTPLHYAIHGLGGRDLIDLFVGRVDMDIPTDINGETPLLIHIKLYEDSALWWDKYAALLDGQVNVNKQDAQGYSPLLVAMEDDRVPVARDLVTQRWAVLPPDFSKIPKSHNMKKLIKEAAASTGQRRDSGLTRATTGRFSFSLHKMK